MIHNELEWIRHAGYPEYRITVSDCGDKVYVPADTLFDAFVKAWRILRYHGRYDVNRVKITIENRPFKWEEDEK